MNIRIGIIDRIRKERLRYFGHMNRMKNERYPKITYNGYVHGTGKRGRQKKRWIDMIREDCSELHLASGGHMQDRRVWRATIDACNGIAWAIIENNRIDYFSLFLTNNFSYFK